MAFTGLAKPYIAKLDENKNATGEVISETYSEAFLCGKAMKVSISPQYAEAKLYGDNMLAEYDKEFSEAEVTLETTFLPDQARTVMLGHEKDSDVFNYGINDTANYVGFGFYTTERVDGVKKYIGIWLPKVKFTEGEESFETKGDSMNYVTPSLSGSATGDHLNNWKYVKTFEDENSAVAWLKTKANVSA